MLERTIHSNGVVTYQSSLLRQVGVIHAFSTRQGGISAGPFATLNLANPGAGADATGAADPANNLRENWHRLQTALGCPRGTLRAWVTQVHGNGVEIIEREPENEYGETLEATVRDRYSGQRNADALVSAAPHVLLSVRVADCVPILIASETGQWIAAVHAGWRGIVARVLESTVGALGERGVPAAQLTAAIGPAISAEHFEVGDEVAAEFERQDLTEVIVRAGGAKPHVNLPRAVTLQLERLGVMQIDSGDLCTHRDAPDFYSHRRDRGITGRMAAVIMARA